MCSSLTGADMLELMDFQLPEWLIDKLAQEKKSFPVLEERMRLVIELSSLNIQHNTGGPFGAAIFDMDTHQLMAAGVNMVARSNCSIAHAEIIALTLAQKAVANFDLGASGLPPCELVSSTEPCAMCFGAIPWSGIRQLVCGAKGEDARRIGFDEGPKHPDWTRELENRGIRVQTDVCREEATQVLDDYHAKNGLIYNARQG
jgi:tRNA(Arg) A34 adenosine deaminase TadA